jgi:hypothetical protein
VTLDGRRFNDIIMTQGRGTDDPNFKTAAPEMLRIVAQSLDSLYVRPIGDYTEGAIWIRRKLSYYEI